MSPNASRQPSRSLCPHEKLAFLADHLQALLALSRSDSHPMLEYLIEMALLQCREELLELERGGQHLVQ